MIIDFFRLDPLIRHQIFDHGGNNLVYLFTG